ncbi:type IV pilus modification protein PilV [[Pseudomonas] boreopolis]|uniref:type IV pilus modification protein PilV n=1 Tax=Xanthomonas boreopolis TaxID=86183 RepID=UPI003D9B2943
MIAVLVLAVGLLGLALLQTMNVRFTQSSNQRTQATNLAYDMLDQIRANRLAAPQYAGDYEGSGTDCEPGTEVSPSTYKNQWQCRLQKALGDDASANVTYDGGLVTVAITWNDQRWSAVNSNETFTVESRL